MIKKEYGGLPSLIAEIKLEPSEMCFVQYLPIYIRDCNEKELRFPLNLSWVSPLLTNITEGQVPEFDYVYLTAKHLYVNKENKGNRHGWHSDGFMTDDINFIWYDKDPTEFSLSKFLLTQDHTTSLGEMVLQADFDFKTYPENSLLQLDEKVIHRCSTSDFEGFRTFVKISFSNQRYNLQGNAHNYAFEYNWKMKPRKEERNHTSV